MARADERKRIIVLLAKQADIWSAVGARNRLVIAWAVQGCLVGLWFFGAIARPLMPSMGRFVVFVPLLALLTFIWSAVEGMLLQRALREPASVWFTTFVASLFPPAAPVLAIVMLLESIPVVAMARRIRRDQCVECGYDLRELVGERCPECGRQRGENPS